MVIRDLRVVRGGRPIIDGLDVAVPAGSVVGLMGPSGSGKTTLMRSVVGVQDRVTGIVEVLGSAAGTPALRRRVGYMTQDASVYTDLTVAQNLRYFAALAGVPSPAKAVATAVATVDLGGHEKQRVGTLSGGERSRVSLAAALVGGPELLVLDEPTVGLDPVLRRDLWAVFRRLAADGLHAPGVQPRHGRGRAVRPSAPHAGPARWSRTPRPTSCWPPPVRPTPNARSSP